MKIAWQQLRALPATAILEAIGSDPLAPRCPRCTARLDVCDDPRYGTSLRCTKSRCRIGRLGWLWPEHALAEIENTSIEAAGRRLLDAGLAVAARAGQLDRLVAVLEKANG